jgi:hypothetical protein
LWFLSVHVVAENNNVAAQLKLKLTSHLEADVPASEAGVSDVARTKAPDQPYSSCAQVLIRTHYPDGKADPMHLPKDVSTSSYERMVDIYQYLGG